MSFLRDLRDRDFEQLVVCRDPATGLESVIAIHDTTLGPALGGVRMRSYADPEDAVRDAMNLAQAMTYKSAVAGLELGGGKSVINAPADSPRRDDLLAAHARFIASLGGRYIPGADMGTGAADMDLIARYVPRVSSRRDPSRFTARGVLRALDAAASWAGVPVRRVAVQGLGKVGSHLVELLRARGVDVVVADVDASRVRGLDAVGVDEILAADVDVVCPCAAGGVLTEAVIDRLKARVVVPGANNALAADADAAMLAARGIVFVPDFVANAGGVIACEAEVKGTDDAIEAKIDAIGATTESILERASRHGTDPLTEARSLAARRLSTHRPYFPAGDATR
ncbi:Glu/Leu/Phe/Val dehydrogenase dimerization domain-containing protein [Cryptosporangium arvum]|uniref:Glutamate dehydrogenase/leucine dehydrogenase n=1 Tax=Cryptosporangium arvum DSM 44712 TaxID=927661 RepID=A0A010YK74_9ACTN|nr:Glu/Leu/Phe/Val dehydrogenase dimerization domain-containing protein [Cryptosporangium arvum]EXG80635.1 glutamate dehydrogenase/leucine dehydrogenase [Cryptosporangium arvum DSM 44712]